MEKMEKPEDGIEVNIDETTGNVMSAEEVAEKKKKAQEGTEDWREQK